MICRRLNIRLFVNNKIVHALSPQVKLQGTEKYSIIQGWATIFVRGPHFSFIMWCIAGHISVKKAKSKLKKLVISDQDFYSFVTQR